MSAIEKFWPVWQALKVLEDRRHRGYSHPLFDPERRVAPLSIGKLHAGAWPSTVPDRAVAEGRLGVFPGEDCAQARHQMEETVRHACAEDEWLRAHPVVVEWFEGQFEPGQTDPEAAILAELDQAHSEVVGHSLARRGVPYGSDLRLFTRYAAMPAVLYGPGDVRLAHAANEQVPLEELVVAAQVLTRLIALKLA